MSPRSCSRLFRSAKLDCGFGDSTRPDNRPDTQLEQFAELPPLAPVPTSFHKGRHSDIIDVMSNWLVSFMFSVGSCAWIYQKLQRYSGNNTQQSLVVTGIIGVILFIFAISLLSMFVK
jgi:hypothetical protein